MEGVTITLDILKMEAKEEDMEGEVEVSGDKFKILLENLKVGPDFATGVETL